MQQTKNIVKIEGILSEVDLKYGSFKKNGRDMKSIGGTIKVQVEQTINGETVTSEIPVHMFASALKNDGTDNPVFASIEKIKNDYVSLASATSPEEADYVRITNGNISMNEYYPQGSERLVSFPRVNASFVNKIKKDDCKPQATFEINFVVAQKEAEVDREGNETGRYKIMGVIPQYGGKVDVVPFYAVSRGVIDAVSSYWNPSDTVAAIGKLNFSSKTETYSVEVDFGEPQEKTRTINVSDLIITGGSQTPVEGEFAYNTNEIQTALAERKARLEQLKVSATTPAKKSSAPAASGFGSNLDF